MLGCLNRGPGRSGDRLQEQASVSLAKSLTVSTELSSGAWLDNSVQTDALIPMAVPENQRTLYQDRDILRSETPLFSFQR